MTPGPLFSQQEIADAAFALLTSSSLERYVRMAQQAAVQAQLHKQLRMTPQMIPDLIRRAKDLWRALLRSAQRDVPEVELAILLTLLARTAVPAVDQLLVDLSLVDCPTVAWIGGLARRLLQERTSNIEQSFGYAQPARTHWQTSSSAEAYLGPGNPSPLETACSKEHASHGRIVLMAA